MASSLAQEMSFLETGFECASLQFPWRPQLDALRTRPVGAKTPSITSKEEQRRAEWVRVYSDLRFATQCWKARVALKKARLSLVISRVQCADHTRESTGWSMTVLSDSWSMTMGEVR